MGSFEDARLGHDSTSFPVVRFTNDRRPGTPSYARAPNIFCPHLGRAVVCAFHERPQRLLARNPEVLVVADPQVSCTIAVHRQSATTN